MNLAARQAIAVGFKARAFVIALRKRADNANAGYVVAHRPHHLIDVFLNARIQPNAAPRNQHDPQRQKRERRDQNQTQPEIQHQRNNNAAEQENRRAHAQSLHSPERLIDVVGIARQPRNQARHRDLVQLARG